MNEDVISFGDKFTYKWKYIIIDPMFGLPILFNGKEVGGFYIRSETWRHGVEVVMMEGIEIDPEYRGRGIGTEVVKMLLEQCKLMVGSITEDEAKPFWKKMKAEFRPIPLESFPEYMLPTIKTKDPIFFFITRDPLARTWAEMFAVEVPKLMKDLPAPLRV